MTDYFFQTEQIKLIQGDALEQMEKLYQDNGSYIDMIFADPPYFLSNGGITCKSGSMSVVDKGDWDKSQGIVKDHQFHLKWIYNGQRLLKPGGTMFVSGTFHGIYSIGFAMQELGMKLLNNITWVKPNPPPNLSCRYFVHSTENIIWAAKNANSVQIFNYQHMKQINDGKQMKDVWCFSAPQKSEKTCGKHPTQKPVSLLERIVLSSTKEGDLILDPFSGSGTTGVACLLHKRNYIGIEMDSNYLELSSNRFKNIDVNNEKTKGK